MRAARSGPGTAWATLKRRAGASLTARPGSWAGRTAAALLLAPQEADPSARVRASFELGQGPGGGERSSSSGSGRKGGESHLSLPQQSTPTRSKSTPLPHHGLHSSHPSLTRAVRTGDSDRSSSPGRPPGGKRGRPGPWAGATSLFFRSNILCRLAEGRSTQDVTLKRKDG